METRRHFHLRGHGGAAQVERRHSLKLRHEVEIQIDLAVGLVRMTADEISRNLQALSLRIVRNVGDRLTVMIVLGLPIVLIGHWGEDTAWLSNSGGRR